MTTAAVPTGPVPIDTGSDVLLSDGTIAVIRALAAEDRAAVTALHDDVSDSSFRLRFFSSGRAVGRQYVDHLFSDHGPTIALVAVVQDRIVAIGTAERLDSAAEVAFLIDDTHRGHGVGTLLLEHLAAAGRDRGLTRFTAEVLTENTAMLGVFRAAGFHIERATSQGVSDVEMSTTASARAVEAADARESRSEARSLESLLAPRRVAVVGASRSGAGIGSAVLTSILAGGFTGELVVVHPSADALAGVAAYARLVDVPGRVDLVVVVVPAEQVLDVMADAVAAHVAAVVVVSSGFAETGPHGADLQHRLVQLARRHSIRLIGPNCLGVLAGDPQVRLDATFASSLPPAGGLAVASQSGGVGIVLLDAARRTGLGVGAFVSLGNKADVSGNDLLSAWIEEPRVTAAALYLESLGNAAKFARLARRFSARKPLMVVLGGTSSGGRRAGISHTGAAPASSGTSAMVVEALAEHSGVIACHSAEELAETALVLAEQPLPAGRRIAVLSNAGGMGVLVADAADLLGLDVPELTTPLRQRLISSSPALAGTTNPIDLGAGATPATVSRTVGEVLDSGEVDAIVVVLVATRVGDPAPLVAAIAQARSTAPTTPVLLVSIAAEQPQIPGSAITVLPSVAAALGALARIYRYAAWLEARRTSGAAGAAEPPTPDDTQAAAARSLAAALGDGWLDEVQAGALVAAFGLALDRPLPPWPIHSGAEHHGVVVRLGPDPALGQTVTLTAYDGAAALLLLPADDDEVDRTVAKVIGSAPTTDPTWPASVAQVVGAVTALATGVPRVREVEAVVAPGTGVVAVRVRLGGPTVTEADSPRRLRVPR